MILKGTATFQVLFTGTVSLFCAWNISNSQLWRSTRSTVVNKKCYECASYQKPTDTHQIAKRSKMQKHMSVHEYQYTYDVVSSGFVSLESIPASAILCNVNETYKHRW